MHMHVASFINGPALKSDCRSSNGYFLSYFFFFNEISARLEDRYRSDVNCIVTGIASRMDVRVRAVSSSSIEVPFN